MKQTVVSVDLTSLCSPSLYIYIYRYIYIYTISSVLPRLVFLQRPQEALLCR